MKLMCFVSVFFLFYSSAYAEYVRGHYRSGQYVSGYLRNKGSGKYKVSHSKNKSSILVVEWNQDSNKNCLKKQDPMLVEKTITELTYNFNPIKYVKWKKRDNNTLFVTFSDNKSFFFMEHFYYAATMLCLKNREITIKDYARTKRWLDNLEFECCLEEEFYRL